MLIERDLAGLQAAIQSWTSNGETIALVPTMGALHEGHLSLLATARAAADRVITSIFVNPLQFGPHEDLDRYPRDEAGDLEKLRLSQCDLAWLPTPEVMHPASAATFIDPAGPALMWEGDARPGHFRGVATVCAKLFMMTKAHVAVFGEKDWQQLQVVKRTVQDLHLPINIIAVETARAADGLALSSRNRRLTPDQREQAALVPKLLRSMAEAIEAGCPVGVATLQATQAFSASGLQLEYLAVVDEQTLLPSDDRQKGLRILFAAALGDVRLIDNWAVNRGGPDGPYSYAGPTGERLSLKIGAP